MSDFQAIADRVEIEALRGEFTDAAMMHDRARLVSLFTPDGVLRMPNIPIELAGQKEIRAGGERLQSQWDFFVQTTHPGTIQLEGDTAVGRAYISELGHLRDGSSQLNYSVYHDRYQRTPDGWKFTERLYEVRHLDTSPLTGSAPRPAGRPPTRRPFRSDMTQLTPRLVLEGKRASGHLKARTLALTQTPNPAINGESPRRSTLSARQPTHGRDASRRTERRECARFSEAPPRCSRPSRPAVGSTCSRPA